MSFFNQILNKIKSLGKTNVIIILGTIILTSLFIFAFLIDTEKKSILYSDLSQEDQKAIVEKLYQKGVKYNIDDEKKSILVPKEDVFYLRAYLAKQGLPLDCSVVGYELYEKEESIGTTSAVQHVRLVRALQGELTRTIRSFDKVLNARVHLALPQREVFSQERQLPTVSVMLSVSKRQVLDSSTVNAICHFLSSSVPNLKKENVTIIDSNGNALHIKGKSMGTNNKEFRGKDLEQKLEYENNLKSEIELMLSKIFGSKNIAVKVDVDMDFDVLNTLYETYDPDKVAENKVNTREKIDTSSNESEQDADLSSANNISDADQQSSQESSSKSQESEKSVDYLVSKMTQNKVHQVGKVKKISVAVLINSNYDKSYVMKSEQDIEKIKQLVKASIGYNEDREDQISVENMPFFVLNDDQFIEDEEKNENWFKENIYHVLKIVLIAVSLLLMFFYVIRPFTFSLRSKEKVVLSDEGELSKEKNMNNILSQSYQDNTEDVLHQELQKLFSSDKETFVDNIKKLLNKK